MSAISPVLRRAASEKESHAWLTFWCPGCQEAHGVCIKRPKDETGPVWGWNGSVERPTFTPSIVLQRQRWEPPVTHENLEDWKREPWEQSQVNAVCHSFVTNGRIEFLGDCTHALAGQTVDLPRKWEG